MRDSSILCLQRLNWPLASVTYILGRVNHPQTNGKAEKLFDEIRRKIRFSPSIDECIHWYNTIKPHGALDYKTPIEAYCPRAGEGVL